MRWMRFALIIIILGLLAYVLTSADLKEAYNALNQVDGFYFFLAFVSYLASFFIFALRNFYFFSWLLKPGYLFLLETVFAGFFLNTITPGAQIGGDPAKAYAFGIKYKKPISKTLVAFMAESFQEQPKASESNRKRHKEFHRGIQGNHKGQKNIHLGNCFLYDLLVFELSRFLLPFLVTWNQDKFPACDSRFQPCKFCSCFYSNTRRNRIYRGFYGISLFPRRSGFHGSTCCFPADKGNILFLFDCHRRHRPYPYRRFSQARLSQNLLTKFHSFPQVKKYNNRGEK